MFVSNRKPKTRKGKCGFSIEALVRKKGELAPPTEKQLSDFREQLRQAGHNPPYGEHLLPLWLDVVKVRESAFPRYFELRNRYEGGGQMSHKEAILYLREVRE